MENKKLLKQRNRKSRENSRSGVALTDGGGEWGASAEAVCDTGREPIWISRVIQETLSRGGLTRLHHAGVMRPCIGVV
jgi:hypothetical protein